MSDTRIKLMLDLQRIEKDEYQLREGAASKLKGKSRISSILVRIKAGWCNNQSRINLP